MSEGAGIQDDMRGWSYGNEGEPGIPSRAIELLREGADEIDRLEAALAVAEREREVAIGVIERIGAEISDYAGRDSSTTDRERGRA